MNLTAAHFAEFFQEVNGCDPFPWQDRLLRRLVEKPGWPDLLALPTGSGKTSVLEIALFHLALEATRPDRQAPLRIAFVVDRRLIVDQAFQQAEKLRGHLLEAKGPVTMEIAQRLKRLGNGEPLHVAKLRGGMPQESLWARTPTQPTILLSTVDQVGSRLLFRGYGVSDGAKPIHAGLLHEDCLIFLDEAHLSAAFRETAASPVIGARLVTLSATPPAGGVRERFELADEDREHPILKPRLNAPKPAALMEGRNYVEEALALADAANVLVVVNRVALARQIFDDLRRKLGEKVKLITGRVRDLDRHRILQEIEPHVAKNRTREDKIVVVSTQTIEAGADYDFDALVTQIAPFDSLKQRFGRLNRTGRSIAAQARILGTKDDFSKKKTDPVYGDRMATCWEFLKQAGPLDFGIQAGLPPAPEEACTEPKQAPVLMPPYLDFWTQTSPRPSVEPDVALFLHGDPNASADVNLVWRDDLGYWDHDSQQDKERVKRLLDLMPPRSGETMAVPVYAVKAWLQGRRPLTVADVEGGSEPEDRDTAPAVELGPVFRCRKDDYGFVWSNEIQPGDTLVVPSRYGGCDPYGWNPGDPTPVVDLAEDAAEPYAQHRFFVRLHASRFVNAEPGEPHEDTWRKVEAIIYAERDDPAQLVNELLGRVPEEIEQRLQRLPKKGISLENYYEGGEARGVILHARGVDPKQEVREEESLAESDEEASLRTSAVSLKDHTAAVVQKVREFTDALPLDAGVKADLALAAELHDLGKGDRRFQAYLHGSATFKSGEAPLAKSEKRRAFEQNLCESVGLPKKWRHEALSVRLAMQSERLRTAHDPLLVLWLVGTHHGYGRPFFPHQDPLDAKDRHVIASDGCLTKIPGGHGPQELAFDLDGLDWPSLFDELNRKYKPWRLAYYEAILRLADHRASEEADQ